MAESAWLHRNLLLLTQIVPPSDELQKLYREGMFDKPNTAGFVHVSHYLLTVYDAECFKKLVQWPVTCKKTEAKYRNDVRDMLNQVASNNPDIGFPPILASHLFHASGSKFILIMCKLSQVAMREYIKRENKLIDIMPMPKAVVASNLKKQFLHQMKAKISTEILEYQKLVSQMEKLGSTVVRNEEESLSQIKTEIFKKEKTIATLVSDAPVHISVKKRLMDVTDTEVIEMWKANIEKGLKQINNLNNSIRGIGRTSCKVRDIIVSSSDTEVLDGRELEKAVVSNIPDSIVPPDVQCLLYHLYRDNNLVFHSYIKLFSLLLNQMYQTLTVQSIKDPSNHLSVIETCLTYVKSKLNIYQACLTDVGHVSVDAQRLLSQRKEIHSYNDTQSPVDNVLLMPSPHINIDPNIDEKSDFQKRLQLTPVEASYKALFSRYMRRNQNHIVGGPPPKQKTNFIGCKVNLADMLSLTGNERQSPRLRVIPSKASILSVDKQIGKYSRLFSKRTMKGNRTVNSSVLSLPSTAKANSTAIANAIGEIQDLSELNLDITVKSFSDLSVNFNTPRKTTCTAQGESPRTVERDDMLSPLPVKPVAQACETTATNEANNDHSTQKIVEPKQPRRSIGDLVERYRKLLDARNRTPSPHIGDVQQSGV